MEETNALLKIIDSLWQQLVTAPSHLLVILLVIVLGLFIKVSPIPNRLIPWILITVGTTLYSLIAEPNLKMYQSFTWPRLVLAIYGVLLSAGAILLHHTVLTKWAWFCAFQTALVTQFGPPPKIDPAVPMDPVTPDTNPNEP